MRFAQLSILETVSADERYNHFLFHPTGYQYYQDLVAIRAPISVKQSHLAFKMGSNMQVMVRKDEEVRIKSESCQSLRVVCKDPQSGDKLNVLPVGHTFKPYTLLTRKDNGWWLFGKDTKKCHSVVWKENIHYTGIRVFNATEFEFDSQNPQGYQLNEVVIKDGPVDNYWR